MYVYIVITAPTSISQATPSLMVDMFITTTQAVTATSTSSLINGKVNSVLIIEILFVMIYVSIHVQGYYDFR